MIGKPALKGLVVPERIFKPAMASIDFKGRLNQLSHKEDIMLNWNPKCEPKKFVGGKPKRMIGRSGSPVRNHWTIDVGHGVALQSYNSIVAFRFTENFGKFKKGCVLLDNDTWKCSATTACYRRLFLEEGIAETKKKIISGEYRLKALNFVHTLDNLERPTDFY